MNLIFSLFIVSCAALNTTIDFIGTNRIGGEFRDDVAASTYYDMKQIRHAIDNSEKILKTLHAKRNPLRFQPSDVVQFYCAHPGQQIFTQTFFYDTNTTQKLDITKPVVFILHGWMDTAFSPWVVELSDVWVTNRNTNVCRVNWSLFSAAGYITAATSNIRFAAEFVASFIQNLHTNHSMPYNNVTIAAHSLGAHLAGFVGQILQSQIGKIFGLDPAGPLFTVPKVLSINDRLDATDAQKVVIIHSCDGVLGINIACGYQDFYPNRGKFPQKGCKYPSVQQTFDGRNDPIRCAHLRSVQYLIESLKPNNKCYGVRCKNVYDHIIRKCYYRELLQVDSVGSPGLYYFTTSLANCTGNVF